MNIKELSQFDVKDFKNIDFEEIKERFLSRPDYAIGGTILIVALFLTLTVYNKYKSEKAHLNQQIPLLIEKLEVVEHHKKIKKEYEGFVNSFPSFVVYDKIINLFSKIAAKHRVQITSFSPAKREDNEFIRMTQVTMNVTTKNYDDLVSFMEAVGNISEALRLTHWSGGMRTVQSTRRRQQTTGEKTIWANFSIEAVQLIDE